MLKPQAVIIAGVGMLPSLAKKYYARMQDQLDGAPIITLPKGGLGAAKDSYLRVAEELDSFGTRTPLTIFGHSLGGLMAIRYAAKDPTTGIRVTLISSPVQGSVACLYAGFIPGMASLFPILADMSPDSKFVIEGQKMLGDLLYKTTCMYCKVDGVIWPASSCYVDGANQIIRLPDGVNHVTEIQDARVVRQIGRIHAQYVMAA